MASRNRITLSAIAVAALLDAAPAGAQLLDLSKFPDIMAQWHRPAGIGIQWDQTKRVGPPQQAPLTPEYQTLYRANLADQAAGGQGADPTGRCIPPGMPRMMTVVFPMEIVILPNVTYILTDYTESRRIYTDGRGWPKELESTYNGYSIGRWIDEDGDGRYDLLEVETRGPFKGPRTYEASGILLHEDGETIIRERIYPDKTDKDVLHDEITTIDHALTRPWTVMKNYRREANPIWHFNDCDENNHHVWIGKENYYVSADGYLMPVKKNQAPPDLKYFNQSQK
jgi:hypothetical protein